MKQTCEQGVNLWTWNHVTTSELHPFSFWEMSLLPKCQHSNKHKLVAANLAVNQAQIIKWFGHIYPPKPTVVHISISRAEFLTRIHTINHAFKWGD